ncbi:MAG: InlB B-repeat-containing protein [Oscillospiraceae bacterium]
MHRPNLRILTVLVALLLCIAMLPTTVFAAGSEIVGINTMQFGTLNDERPITDFMENDTLYARFEATDFVWSGGVENLSNSALYQAGISLGYSVIVGDQYIQSVNFSYLDSSYGYGIVHFRAPSSGFQPVTVEFDLFMEENGVIQEQTRTRFRGRVYSDDVELVFPKLGGTSLRQGKQLLATADSADDFTVWLEGGVSITIQLLEGESATGWSDSIPNSLDQQRMQTYPNIIKVINLNDLSANLMASPIQVAGGKQLYVYDADLNYLGRNTDTADFTDFSYSPKYYLAGAPIEDAPAQKYQITYYANHPNAVGDVPVDTGRYFVGESITILSPRDSGDPIRVPGLLFVGWNTVPDGTGEFYSDQISHWLHMPNGDINLYAQFRAPEEVLREIDVTKGNLYGDGPFVDLTIQPEGKLRFPLNEECFIRRDGSTGPLDISFLKQNEIGVQLRVTQGGRVFAELSPEFVQDGQTVFVEFTFAKLRQDQPFQAKAYLTVNMSRKYETEISLSGTLLAGSFQDGGSGSNSGSGGSGSGSSGGGRADTGSSGGTTTGTTASMKPLTKADAEKLLEEAVQAKPQGQKALSVKVSNRESVELSVLQAIQQQAAKAATPLTLHFDTVQGGKVVSRISLNPAESSKNLNLLVSTDSVQAKKVQNIFSKWFSNQMFVISCSQQNGFGQTVDLAVPLPEGFATNQLNFYSYDSAANKYQRISPAYHVDKNGYLHIITDVAGDIVVSQGPLVKH